MSKININLRNLVRPFEGEPTATPTTTPTTTPTPTPTATTFSQDDVNRIVSTRLKEDRDKGHAANQKTITELRNLQAAHSTSEEAKQVLEQQIETLSAQFQTKEQLLLTEQQKLEKKYKEETDKLTTERNNWRQRHDQHMIAGTIASAASQHKAFNVGQIAAILAPNTKVIEEVGSDGKATGNLVPKVDFMGVDADGKPQKLVLSVSEAVKMMTDMPDQYGNLFNSGAASGTGRGTTGSLPKVALDNDKIGEMSVADYLKNREDILGKVTNEQ